MFTCLQWDYCTSMADQSFIIVKYGDDQQALFNPWCTTHTLIEWIRKKCNCSHDITIDLIDQDGQVKNLAGSNEEYANELVNGRETYILIRVEKAGENGQNRYVSLLNNLEHVNPDLMVKLNNLSRPATRNRKDRYKKTNKSGKSGSKPDSPNKRPTSSERRSKLGK
ncbi:uncharacterized protein C22orf15-like [Haliotis asinina]|uniref:uncharacterized protein C22orf15-like n=1 Tax=Haliotis asinina TaxID=109174 RepID=UPI003531E211